MIELNQIWNYDMYKQLRSSFYEDITIYAFAKVGGDLTDLSQWKQN